MRIVEPERQRSSPREDLLEQSPQVGRAGQPRRWLEQRGAEEVIGGEFPTDERLLQRRERLQQGGLAHAGWSDQEHQEGRARIGQHLAQLGIGRDQRRVRDAVAHEALEAHPLLGGQPRQWISQVRAGLRRRHRP